MGTLDASLPPYLAGDMMTYTRLVALTVLSTYIGIGVAQAQNLRDHQAPAEFPPSSYQGAQYVDSKGCIYIRAGIDGNVTWVPRVDRQRKLICGQTPTFPKPQPVAAASSPPAASSGKVTEINVEPRPARAPVKTAAVTVPTQPKTSREALPVVPQKSVQSIARPAQSNEPGPLTRVVPAHVYASRAAYQEYRVPRGYKRAWTDDRLNPRRAEQNLNGIASMRLIWTRTVPRRLVDRNTGRDVTETVPLVYPFTDINAQQKNLGKVTVVRVDGRVKKRVERNRVKAPTSEAARAVTQEHFVQVGTYKNPSNAKAAARLVANSGLPARIGKKRRLGTTYQVVVAGPFATSESLNKGLKQARALGFKDAFVRN